MKFWKYLEIAGLVALVVVVGLLFAMSDDNSKQHNSTPSATSSPDGAAFSNIK